MAHVHLPSSPNDADHAMMRRATRVAVTVAVLLAIVKLVASSLTDSVSILASFLDSTVDIAASLVTLMAVRVSLTPADHDHRFGHGKAEPLAALAQSTFLLGSALFLGISAVGRLAHPAPVSQGAVGIAVMVVSIVATAGLVLYQRHVARKTGSMAIEADSVHYASDFLMNAAVIVSLILSTELGWWAADPILALAVVIVLTWSAWKIARGAIDVLMDRELPEAERAEIAAIASADPEVVDCHDLKTRASAHRRFIQLHLTLDGDQTLRDAHHIGDRVVAAVRARFANAEVIVHHDPAEPDA